MREAIKDRKVIDLRFGRLVVKSSHHTTEKGRPFYTCECDCGKSMITDVYALWCRGTKSCGCLRDDVASETHLKHGMSETPTYHSWESMIQRCNNINSCRYSHYGNRNITICKSWLKFENFLKDMGIRPEGLSIDRIDNDKGYYKENCRWTTQSQQTRNQRIHTRNKTGIRGVCWVKQRKKYLVQIMANNKNHFIGYFDSIESAAIARLNAEQKYWGKECH